MEKYKFDENNGLWYELQGDYYLPCLKLPEKEQPHIGIWGQRHLRYLKKHHRVFRTSIFYFLLSHEMFQTMSLNKTAIFYKTCLIPFIIAFFKIFNQLTWIFSTFKTIG